ncbi:MAG TPA: 4Fe-4S dicluster domain-containing protein [Nitrososphaerales archaeon]|nr:4Fe-4S dicluster domain-containing protein [Nitrososphaerales archaeon]
MTRWGMVIDLAKCVGCDACTVACKMENMSPGNIYYAPVLHAEVGKYPNAHRVFIPTLCMHCDDPPCIKSCAAKAITKRKDGIVEVDGDSCIGSKACVVACPYGAMHFFDHTLLGSEKTPLDNLALAKFKVGTAQKCTFCSHRVDSGLKKGLKPGVDREASPACVITCPTQCRIFGDLDDPNSNPSRLIEKRNHTVLRSEAKTGPNVVFLFDERFDGKSTNA